MSHMTRNFRRTLGLASLGLLVAASSPAIAGGNAEAAKSEASAKSEGKAKKYCLSESVSGDSSVTGSMLSRKKCLTKEQWRARGVQIQKAD